MQHFEKKLYELDDALQQAWHMQSFLYNETEAREPSTAYAASFPAIERALQAKQTRKTNRLRCCVDKATQACDQATASHMISQVEHQQHPQRVKMRRSAPTAMKHAAAVTIQRHVRGWLARQATDWRKAIMMNDWCLLRRSLHVLKEHAKARTLLRVRARRVYDGNGADAATIIAALQHRRREDACAVATIEGKHGVANMFKRHFTLHKALISWVVSIV